LADDLHSIPRPGGVLFDLDGTLVDTVEARIEAWARVFDEVGIPVDRRRLGPLIGVDGKRLAREVAAGAGLTISDQRAEDIDRRCGDIYETLSRDPQPLPGVRALVEAIEVRGVPWAIATSSRRDQVGRSVASLGLEREPAIVDGSHVEHAKPEPDLLLLAARQVKVEPARCWYVGDATWDMVAAVAAAMIPIGVTAGAAVDETALRGAGAAVVVGSLLDLADALTRR
jgi:HAD superfamily hydrolase (TIGR01509 family)